MPVRRDVQGKLDVPERSRDTIRTGQLPGGLKDPVLTFQDPEQDGGLGRAAPVKVMPGVTLGRWFPAISRSASALARSRSAWLTRSGTIR